MYMLKRISMSTIIQWLLSSIALLIYLLFSYNTALIELNYYSMLYLVPSTLFVLIMLLVNNKSRFSWYWTKDKWVRLIIRIGTLMFMGLFGLGFAAGVKMIVEAYSLVMWWWIHILTNGAFHFGALIPSGVYAIFEFLMVSEHMED